MVETISNETADQIKFLLKTLISETMVIEDKEARLKMLPHILEGIDLFDLKR
jgi:hypothetical protein